MKIFPQKYQIHKVTKCKNLNKKLPLLLIRKKSLLLRKFRKNKMTN